MNQRSGVRKELIHDGVAAPEGRSKVGGEDLLTPRQAAEYIGRKLHGAPYSVRTFYNLKYEGVIGAPDEIRRGRPRWYRSTLDAWVATQIQRPATAARARSKKAKTK